MNIINGSDYLEKFPNFKLVNRENDLERISSILSRKQNNSLLLSGPGGVGASSIVLGLQASKNLPSTSFDILTKKLFWLDTDGLFSSGDSKEINDEFQKIIRNLERTPNSVLVISDAFNFIEAAKNTGNTHFINALNDADKSHSFQVIMEVRDDQLTTVFKWNSAISELYTLYDVKEPNGKALNEIVTNVAKELIDYHGIDIDASAIEEAIHLCSKYRDSLGLGGAQPRRAISLLDRSLSSYKQAVHKNHPVLTKLKDEIDNEQDIDRKRFLEEELARKEIAWADIKAEITKVYIYQAEGETLRMQLSEELDNLLKEEEKSKEKNKEIQQDQEIKSFAQFASGCGFDSPRVTTIKEKIQRVDKEIEANIKKHKELIAIANKDLCLSKKDVIIEFSKISGISAAKLDENEIEILRNLETNLLSRIYGQDEAVEHVANAVKVSKIDTLEESGPAVSYLFLGPSGVGKTEMAKALAQHVLGDEKLLIRFDMSEYMEKHAVAKLIGAPPGYEGFEAGGILTNTVRKNPVGIYLFDEIEKAHPDVFNIFLQILSDGRLTDNIGRTVDFSEIIIIMTSNIGQKYYLDKSLSDEAAKGLATEELNSTYRSELLNRFNGRENILHFKRLSLDIIEKIIHREISKMNASYEPKGIKLEISSNCVAEFCHDHYDVIRGARGLPGYIKANLRPIVVNHLLTNAGEKGTFITHYNTESKKFEVTFKADEA